MEFVRAGGGSELEVDLPEFLTHETNCASEMLEKTTCEIFCQKRPPTSGGTRGTCRLGQCRQAPAAVAIAGRPLRVGPAAILVAGKVTWHSE
jgi:hypothetical protein